MKFQKWFKLKKFPKSLTYHKDHLCNGQWKELDMGFKVNDFRVRIHWQHPKEFFGRFGGGWNWELGAQWGGRTVLLNCLTFSIRISWEKS